MNNALVIFGFYFQVKSGRVSISKTSKLMKISYGIIWNKVNGKNSGKIGGQCYVNSTLEKVVVDSFE